MFFISQTFSDCFYEVLLDPHQLIMPTIYVAPPSPIHIWITYLALLNTCPESVYTIFRADTFVYVFQFSSLACFFCLLHYSQSVSRSVAFLRSIRRAKISNPLACGRRRKTKILYIFFFFWRADVVVMVAACGESNEYLCLVGNGRWASVYTHHSIPNSIDIAVELCVVVIIAVNTHHCCKCIIS